MAANGWNPREHLAQHTDRLKGSAEDGEEGGTGLHPERHQTLMLRLFTGSGCHWIMYGAVGGGEQDPGGTWFQLYYRGVVRRDGKLLFGDFTITVKGDGLEPVCQHIGRGIRTTLKVGTARFNNQTLTIDSIEISPVKVEPMEPED